MNESILNNSIVKSVSNYLTTTIKSGTEKVVDTVKDNVPIVWMANIVLGMLALLAIFIASKVTQKFAKLLLYILGIVLLVGLVLNFVM